MPSKKGLYNNNNHHNVFNPDSYIPTHAGVSLEPEHDQQTLNHHPDGDAPAFNLNHHHHQVMLFILIFALHITHPLLFPLLQPLLYL